MKNITPKQQGFIRSLVARTHAYESGEGMVAGMNVYPRLHLEAALGGEVTSREASQIIEALLAAPQVDTAPQSTEPTARQLSYATTLLERQGRNADELDGLTRKEVSSLIDALRATKAA